jgi:hypothetical protein
VAVFTPSSSNFTGSNNAGITPTNTLTVIQEYAKADYTGAEFASTGTATATTANLRLSATITDDADANRGEITNAKVRFKIVGMSANLAEETPVYTSWRSVTLITSDKTMGTAVLDTAFSVGNLDAKAFNIYVQVGSYYKNDDSTALKATIRVSKSLNDYITGGGNLSFGSGTANTTSGVYRSNDNSKTNFGFNVKYSKSGNNLQGNVNIIIRSGSKTYQVKGVVGGSNGSLSTNVNDKLNKKAVLTSKANMFDTETGLSVPNGSSATLELKMSDKGEPGANIDTYAITIWGSNGALLYSSNWSGSITVETPIKGGNIQVNSTATFGATTPTIYTQQSVTMNNMVPEVTDTKFGLKAFPNPSSTQFNVHLESSNTTDKITLRVYDLNGRTVRLMQDLRAGQTVQFGSEYRPGIYFVEILQGSNRKQVKLLKAIY